MIDPPHGSVGTGVSSGPIEPRDEAPHEHGDEPGWSERHSFSFFDGAAGFGGLVRVEFRPGDGIAEGSLNVFVPGGALATVLVREETPGGGASIGRLRLDPYEALARWRIRCADVALVFSDAGAAGLPPSGKRHGAAAQIEVDLSFDAWMPPNGAADRRTDVSDERFVRVTSSGHFEQAGFFAGNIRVGNRRAPFAGAGVRDRSWGARNDTATHTSRWFAVAFGPDLAFGVRLVTIGARQMRSGWVFRSGAVRAIASAHAEMSYEGRSARGIVLGVTDETGERYDLTGETISILPLKQGAARVDECMTRYRLGEREALGLAELVEG